MFSLRSLARAAPRTLRVASYSTKTSFIRPALRTTLPSRILTQTPRCFSSTPLRKDASSQELAAKLESEINLETESEEQTRSDSNVESWLSSNPDWTLENTEGQQEVLLTRKEGDETITVSFSIADFNTSVGDEFAEEDDALADEDFDGQSGGGNSKNAVSQGRTADGNVKLGQKGQGAPGDREALQDEEDAYSDEDQSAFPANVDVLIQRSGKGALKINLTADASRFDIHNITQIPASQTGTPSELINSSYDTLYAGPPFQQLDEDLQLMLEAYLQERGINESLATFIPEYIDVKEQKEYVAWLKRVKSFVE